MEAPRSNAEPPILLPPSSDAHDDEDSRVAEEARGPTPPSHDAPLDVADPAVVPVAASAARRTLRWTLFAGVVALMTVGAVEFVGWRNAGAAAMQRVLLVEPMQVASGDAAAAALRAGFFAELARMLVAKPAFVVRDAEHESGEAPERTFVVLADAQTQNGVIHVGLRMLARKDGPTLWAATLERPAGEVAALREQMAAKIADVATCALDGRHTDLRTFRPETLQLLLGACDLRHADSRETAKLLEQLTREMPDFGHGWAMLAAATAGDADATAPDPDGAPSRVESYARRALDVDPHDGEAYFGRAFGLTGIAQWPERMAILRAGLAKDPDNADLAFALAVQLAQVGRTREAIEWSERAVHEDPFSPLKATEHAKLLGLAALPFGPQASIAFDSARRRFGADHDLMLADFRFQALAGDHRRAAQLLADPDRGFHLRPERAALWAALIATRADPSAAHDDGAERAFAASMQALPDINLWTIETLSFLHRVDEAYAYADRMPAPSINEDVIETLFSGANEALRADPRFMTLAARLGLVAIWRQTGQWPDFCGEPTLAYDCRIEADRALSGDARPLVDQRPRH